MYSCVASTGSGKLPSWYEIADGAMTRRQLLHTPLDSPLDHPSGIDAQGLMLTSIRPTAILFCSSTAPLPPVLPRNPLDPRRQRRRLATRMRELDTDHASVGVHKVDDALEAWDVVV